MTQPSTIERLPDESAKAYQARVEYVTMGPQRSQEAVSQRLGKSRQLMYRWATRYDWTATARAWDDQQAAALQAEAAAQYRADLAAHRKRAGDASQALYAVAGQLITAINKALAGPRQIRGDDGKVYTLHSIELTANTFQIAAKAMQTSLDLEAHKLGIDQLMPQLTDDSE